MKCERILRLNKAGYPLDWVTKEEAATTLVKNQILWALGEASFEIKGGYNWEGRRSILYLPSIFAMDGELNKRKMKIPLINKLLFRRDNNRCMYCSYWFSDSELSRDHIIPRSRNGKDVWTNVVAACKRCNNHKANRTPEEANMELLAVPFEPNRYEFLYLSNRNVLGDQMDFLKARFSKNGCWT